MKKLESASMTDAEVREAIIEQLKYCGVVTNQSTKMDHLIAYMDMNGFFEAPCSSQHHLAEKGGLARHTLNVLEVAKSICVGGVTQIEFIGRKDLDWASLVLVCLLHDVGKMGDHFKPNYVDNMIKSKKKDKETGEYPLVQSEAKPYKTNPELAYIPHEVRSVMIAERFIDLSEEEEQAILFHNGLYGSFKYELQGKETLLYFILHTADMLVSRWMEGTKEEKGDCE